MAVSAGPDILEEGLVLHLDASNARSYDPNGRHENLFSYSQEYSNAAWSKSNTTITSNVIAAPDGTITASKLVGDNGVTGRQSIYEDVTTVAGQTYTFSVFVKAGERQYCCVWFDSTNVSEGNFWGSGTVFDLIAGKNAYGSQSGIIRYPNGWYRVHVTATATSTTMRFNLSVGSPNNNVAGYIANGDGTSGIYIGGSQVETGSRVSEYYKTTGSAKTRGTTWYDLSGKGRDSTIEGATWDASGCFSFDGSGERDGDPTGNYITLNTSSTTTDPSAKPNGVTYQWWMKIDADQPNGHAILYGGSTINHLEWKGTSTGGNFRTEAVRQNGYSFGDPSVSGGLDSSLWHNISLVFANNESGRPVRWYKNGTLFHTGSMTGGTYPDTEYFVPNAFGRATGVPEFQYSQSFYGKMSQFLVWDRALTAAEIEQNFNATRGRFRI